MIQREREAEGDEFADKDRFVTQAYKDQLAEMRKAEEEEKLREGQYSLISF
jgi:coiled-coil domain-containing protein 55